MVIWWRWWRVAVDINYASPSCIFHVPSLLVVHQTSMNRRLEREPGIAIAVLCLRAIPYDSD